MEGPSLTRRRLFQLTALAAAAPFAEEIAAQFSFLKEFDPSRYECLYIDPVTDVQYLSRKISVPGLAKQADGTTLAFFTDIHFGPQDQADINEQSLSHIVATTNQIITHYFDPSKLVVGLGGDYVNAGGEKRFFDKKSIPETSVADIATFAKIMDQIQRAAGVFVMGNHDNNHTQRSTIIDELENAGYIRLDGDPTTPYVFNGLPIFGNADELTGGVDFDSLTSEQKNAIDEATKQIYATTEPKVLLTHNPHFFDRADMREYFTNISGHSRHTHGGHFGRATVIRRLLSTLALAETQYKGSIVNGVHVIGNGSTVEVPSGLGTHPAFGKVMTLPGEPQPDHIAIPRSMPRQITFTTFEKAA